MILLHVNIPFSFLYITSKATILRFQPNNRKFGQITGIVSAKMLNYQIFSDAFDSFRGYFDFVKKKIGRY